MSRIPPDLTGRRFGRWLVLSSSDQRIHGQFAYNCRCQCGTERIVPKLGLTKGYSLSCGCIGREILGDYARKHGLSRHRLQGTWRSMKERCYNPSHVAYERYGGRGITVCERWHDLENFIEDMAPTHKPGLSLDRIDNDQPYCLENCRWATAKEQARNRANSRLLTLEGKTQSVIEWAEELNMPILTLRSRIRKWSIEKALKTPYKPQRNPNPRPRRRDLDRDAGQERTVCP